MRRKDAVVEGICGGLVCDILMVCRLGWVLEDQASRAARDAHPCAIVDEMANATFPLPGQHLTEKRRVSSDALLENSP